jgi:lipopolysaccharide/colanic/teichoic acid biosynthesis glycosyltransferase
MAPNQAIRATALDAVGSDDSVPAARGAVALDDFDPASFPIAKSGHEAAQRVMDLVIGAAAAICFLPIAILVASVLVATVGGPVLLREQRVGRGGRVFEVLRFRTMSAGMLRRGRLAKLIYLSRLDELPQLFNVLRGDMSIVGPRPETPAAVARLSASLRGFDLRHRVKPGLTGWSQAMGQWSDRDEAHRLGFDLYYVRHRSVAVDIKVLLRTLSVVLLGGAGR